MLVGICSSLTLSSTYFEDAARSGALMQTWGPWSLGAGHGRVLHLASNPVAPGGQVFVLRARAYRREIWRP